MNDYDPVIKEIEDVDRRLWEEGGGTVHGFFDVCERIADQALAEYAQYGDRWRGVGREPAESVWTPAEGEALCVREGNAPRYGKGKTSDLARKGGEGV